MHPTTYDPVQALVFYVVVLAVGFTILAALADYLDLRYRRRSRDQARAEARAKRQEEMELSHASDYSWQD